jgi:hypothetical protein
MDGYHIVKVEGDGSCLYHAVAAAFACSGGAIPEDVDWVPGDYPACAGCGDNSLRKTLEKFSTNMTQNEHGGLAKMCEMWENVDQETVGCGDKGAAKLIERIKDTPRWAEWEEVALLSHMLNCHICVYHRVNGEFVNQRNCANTLGHTVGSEFDFEVKPKTRIGDGERVRIMIVCQNSQHFDALVPEEFFDAE